MIPRSFEQSVCGRVVGRSGAAARVVQASGMWRGAALRGAALRSAILRSAVLLGAIGIGPGGIGMGVLGTHAARASQLLIPLQAVWRYDDSGTDLGTAWRDPGYDDSGWASGPGVLGYGDPFITTTVSYGPDASQKYVTTYFRIAFDVTDDPVDIHTLSLSANFDDGFVGYLNGVEVARRSMPDGPVDTSTLAFTHEGGSYEPVSLDAFIGVLVPGTNVLAVEVHQTSVTSSDLALDMVLASSTEPLQLTRGPYLQVGTTSSIVIRWRTDRVSESRVEYGTTLANLDRVAGPASPATDPTTEHEVLVEDLFPDTRYYYTVGTSSLALAGPDSLHSFRTPPVVGTPKPTRVWVIGDSGLPGQDQRDVRDSYRAFTGATPTDVWLMLGDNAYDAGSDFQYQVAVFDAYPRMLASTVLWPTRGNHDVIHAGSDNDYYDIFTMPTQGEAGGLASGTEAYYSFDYANVHFVCLDSQGSDRSPGGPMFTWLENDLAASHQDWILAYWHHPPYSKGSHDSDTEFTLIEMRTKALPILEAGGVDLVLCGHSHNYERSFLLDGHYGLSTTLAPENRIDDGDGRVSGTGPYVKPEGAVAHQGAVYAVVGSSSRVGSGTLDHPVMVTSLGVLGSMVLDVAGDRLDATFLDHTGSVLDDFTILKGSGTGRSEAVAGAARTSLGSRPNPTPGRTTVAFRLPHAGRVHLDLYDAAGHRITRLVDAEMPAGEHAAPWDGRDASGAPVASGVYFSRLEIDGVPVRTGKLLLVR